MNAKQNIQSVTEDLSEAEALDTAVDIGRDLSSCQWGEVERDLAVDQLLIGWGVASTPIM